MPRRGKHRSSPRTEKPRGTWGGRRAGAGRKPKGDRALEPHRARPMHQGDHPVLVTLHARIGVLRDRRVLAAISDAIAGAGRWDPESFRVARFVVQAEHVHLVVEADGKRTLSGGMRSVAIRIARSVNDVLGRSGRFWADRWHGRELGSKHDAEKALSDAMALGRSVEAGTRRPGRLKPAER